MRRRHREDLRS